MRTLAVLLVILSHQSIWKPGWVGVQMFFVLSGYLITGILQRSKGAPLGRYLRRFYGRRVLRIFPLYYAYLGVVLLAALSGRVPSGVTQRLSYAAVYLSNHYSGPNVAPRFLLHLWSLAVEEQFYLFWPFLIYFCPSRWLRGTLAGLVLAGVPIRYLAGAYCEAPGYLTLAHVDAFAVGALSALYPVPLRGRLATALMLSLGALGLVLLTHDAPAAHAATNWRYIFGLSSVNLASGLLIVGLVERRFLPRVFEHPVAGYCGKISYGIYIFHFPAQALVEGLLPGAHVLARLVVQLGSTVAVAAVSFALFESRFLAFKDRWFSAVSPAPAGGEPLPCQGAAHGELLR